MGWTKKRETQNSSQHVEKLVELYIQDATAALCASNQGCGEKANCCTKKKELKEIFLPRVLENKVWTYISNFSYKNVRV